MTAVLPIAAAPPADTGAVRAWRRHLVALASVSAAMLLLFHRDLIDMAGIWWRSPTFNHCFLVLPIAVWLVWQRLPELVRLTPAAWMPGLLLLAAGAMLWLLGEAGSVALARHLSLVLIFQGAVIATLGKSVARGIAFPLFYLLFAVPVGEELVPPMQTVTAEITMALLHLGDIPAHIEGIFITTPIGLFEVAEACSGVRFLIAMAAYGALVANVCFRSWPRRLVFLAAAILIPVLANGLRAWGTIYAAERTGSLEYAVGFDHILYGWVFFAVVMVLIMAAGWRFFDRKIGDPWFDPTRFPIIVAPPRRLTEAAAAAIAIAAAPPLWSAMLASVGSAQVPAEIAMPEVEGWAKIPADRGRPWRPHFGGADRFRIQRYRGAAGQEVDLAIAIFARQTEGRELVGYGQGAVGPEDAWAWTADASPPVNGKAERIASHGESREVLSFYRVGTIVTGSAGAVKLETMKVRLLGGPRRAVAILVSAPEPAKSISPRPALDAFLSSLGPIAPLADAASIAPEPR
ncbi:exosortase A [Allosphingosinicella deserti]|uniref:EpsI domain-containing exosortase n=1 Tax=Allosphingosinicella deserti TaxID=2116704 RepID=A0A2P7QPJ6_9SPHN|nr:exosortase A [Sphingomonas deserti]PSJ39868.1 EpsI domain-containing exosortase [Sphingomonas deserti]